MLLFHLYYHALQTTNGRLSHYQHCISTRGPTFQTCHRQRELCPVAANEFRVNCGSWPGSLVLKTSLALDGVRNDPLQLALFIEMTFIERLVVVVLFRFQVCFCFYTFMFACRFHVLYPVEDGQSQTRFSFQTSAVPSTLTTHAGREVRVWASGGSLGFPKKMF